MRRRRPGFLKRKKTAPELPLEPPFYLGNKSTGEYFHETTPMERKIRDEILRVADDNARRVGMDRREFLASAMGMTTSLYVVNLAAACSTPAPAKGPNAGFFDVGGSGGLGGTGVSGAPGGAAGGGVSGAQGVGVAGTGTGIGGTGAAGTSSGMAGRTGASGTGTGGTGMAGADGGFPIPPDAMVNCEMAEDILNGKGEFIFDIQTHHIEEEGMWRMTNPGQADTLATYFAQYNGCMEPDLKKCINAQAYLEKIFLESETTMAVLSGYPSAICTAARTTGCGNPLDNDAMWKSRDHVNALANSNRVVQHCQVNPNDDLPAQLAMMEQIKTQHNCWGFKCYPEWGPGFPAIGYQLDSEQIGIPFIEKARQLNSKIVCIHKGIVFPGWDASAAHPRDVGAVAMRFPDTNFIVYHSAIEINAAGEGVYNPNNTQGTDRLCRTAEMNNLKGKNMYAELGSVWAQVMSAPDKAQHVIGKLLKYLGEDNVVWGSECIWLGSPQMQIETFRAFQISKQFQDMYGYPELTPAIKAKIFGLNAARVYGINVDETRCKIRNTMTAKLKEVMDGELGARRWSFQQMGGPRTRREFMNFVRWTGGKPG